MTRGDMPDFGKVGDNETLRCLFRWMAIKQSQGQALRTDPEGLEVDLRKSALFARLMGGEEPPPCSFSYPWYELMGAGRYEGTGLEVNYNVNLFDLGPCLGINQTIWKVLEHEAERSYICTYKGAKSRWRVKFQGMDKEEVQHQGRESHWAKKWLIERLGE